MYTFCQIPARPPPSGHRILENRMQHMRRMVVGLAVCFATLAMQPAYAQNVTTGSITGIVKDAQGGVLPGATVTALHEPTGTSYEAVTEADGTFNILNVRVGGPYTVTATLAGFKTATQSNIVAKLGEATNLPLTLQIATLSETVEVKGTD